MIDSVNSTRAPFSNVSSTPSLFTRLRRPISSTGSGSASRSSISAMSSTNPSATERSARPIAAAMSSTVPVRSASGPATMTIGALEVINHP